jgi:hypothetical protein
MKVLNVMSALAGRLARVTRTIDVASAHCTFSIKFSIISPVYVTFASEPPLALGLLQTFFEATPKRWD